MLSYVMFVNKEKIVRKTILKMQDRVNSETHGTRLQDPYSSLPCYPTILVSTGPL